MLGIIKEGQVLKTESGCYEDYQKNYYVAQRDIDLDEELTKYLNSLQRNFCEGNFLYELCQAEVLVPYESDVSIWFGDYPDVDTIVTEAGRFDHEQYYVNRIPVPETPKLASKFSQMTKHEI